MKTEIRVRIRHCLVALILPLAGLLAGQALGETRYLSVEQFLQNRLGPAEQLRAETLWLNSSLKQDIADVLGHPFAAIRLRYWASESETAWVLEEIGKEQAITMGFVIGEQGIRAMDVLVYREPRGGEIRHSFFKRQFLGAKLAAGTALDRSIDGITGATLSVRASEKMARLALLLHGHVSSRIEMRTAAMSHE